MTPPKTKELRVRFYSERGRSDPMGVILEDPLVGSITGMTWSQWQDRTKDWPPEVGEWLAARSAWITAALPTLAPGEQLAVFRTFQVPVPARAPTKERPCCQDCSKPSSSWAIPVCAA